MADTQLTWQTVNWEAKTPEGTYTVPIDCLVNPEAGRTVDLYPGLGEERKATERGVQILSEVGVYAAGIVLPFDVLAPTRANIERTVKEAPIAVAAELNLQSDLPEDHPVDLLGKSQGGGAAMLTATEAPERFGALALIAPVGLTNEYLGGSIDARRRQFLWRLAVKNNLTYSMNPVHEGNLAASREVLRRVAKDVAGKRLYAKLNYAMSIDLAEDLARLDEEHPLRVFVGERDPLFKPSELFNVLERYDLEQILRLTAGAHSPILNRFGANQVRKAGEWLKSLDKRHLYHSDTYDRIITDE